MERVSASRLGTFRECPRRFYQVYIRQRVPLAEPAALSFGRVFHSALEQWWLHGPEAAVRWLVEHAAEMDPVEAAKVGAMLGQYNPPIHLYDVIDTEREFVVPIINPESGRRMREYELLVRVDALVRRKSDGSLWLIEHKTTSEQVIGFGPYWQRLSIDHQVAFYLIATGAAGIAYDVCRKPALRISKADEMLAAATRIGVADAYQQRCSKEIEASPEEWYQFREIVKTQADLDEARADLYGQVQMLHNCERRGLFPRNSGACRGLYGVCPYLGVCSGQASIDDDALFRDRHEPLIVETEAA